MKRKQHHRTYNSSNSDAWKKIGIAAVLIVAAFGLLLFFEGRITGSVPFDGDAPPPITSISNIVLTPASPAKLVYMNTVSLSSGRMKGAFDLNLGGAGGTKKQGGFFISEDKKEANLSLAPVNDWGYFKVSENYLLKKGIAQSKSLLVNLSQMEGGKLVNVTVPAKLSVTYHGIKYFKIPKSSATTAKAVFYFKLSLEQPLDLSDGLAKQGLKMIDKKENFIYNGKEYTGLSVGGKTHSFKLVSDPSGEVAVYFDKLSDSVELTKSTTFPVDNNGKVKVTVLGWEGPKLAAEVQWIKPTG